ncbi:GIY-YIG nuclease family protein [uncultured Hymenobacter sp.]|uniref:GIY-YIG nuclease family protein n=1 Tax=uncultured Hymenobacter sp. TaxID=170016 RepID=UPI0035CB7749
MTKEFIISEIIRTAETNGGKPLGKQRFYQETGLKESDWYGKYWARWGDAVGAAGFEPNVLNPAFDSDFILKKLAELVAELSRFPSSGDLRIKATNDKSFPSHNSFNRYGSKSALIAAFKKYCAENNATILLQYCGAESSEVIELSNDSNPSEQNGNVYLYKSGKHYKIGRTNNLERREREIKLQLPLEAELVHRIATDDAVGIERYWHKRFADRRLNGEWFNLTSADVRAFKRRKFM